LSTESVLVGYEAAASDFLRLIESQRQLIGYRDKLVEYQAEYFRRLAELERAIGGPVTSDLHQ
jgi:outer membrane protein TolC